MDTAVEADPQRDPTLDEVCGADGPECLALQSRVFAAVGTVVFRRAAADGTPVMAMSLGDREAALPLRAVQREFGIADASPDGRMLGLIAESLDYVAALRIGDALPSEVLTGEPSWQPPARYREVAAGRLRLQLLSWAEPAFLAGDSLDPAALERLASDRRLRIRLQRAFEAAAATLGLAGDGAVTGLISAIADDLAYIEALRGSLLRRVQAVALRLDALSRGLTLEGERLTVMSRVRRLAGLGLQQVAARFVEVDERCSDIMTLLGEADSLRACIRANRDWLHRTGRAWEPVLAEWEAAPSSALDEAAWQRIGRTYQFLAPRYMPVQEWLAQNRAPTQARRLERAMAW